MSAVSAVLFARATIPPTAVAEAPTTAVPLPAAFFATSEKVAAFGVDTFGMNVNKMGVATNKGYWDALAGAALCGKNETVLVLVDDVNSDAVKYCEANGLTLGEIEAFAWQEIRNY